MAILNGYITLAELKAALRDTQTTYDPLYERAIEAASRQIDTFCNTQFWKVPAPSPRVFKPDNRYTLYTGEFADTTGMVIKTDDDDDGVFETTWSATDFQTEPLNPVDGRPYNRIVALGGKWWPLPYYEYRNFRASGYEPEVFSSQRARVEITANWGWGVVPAQVKQACQIVSIDLFKSKDLTGATAGVQELASGSFGSTRFAGVQIPRFNPIAEALLSGYRLPVIA